MAFSSAFGSCSKKEIAPSTPPRQTEKDSNTTKALSYLALGDSYTIGQNVSVAERFPSQTATRLTSFRLTVSPPAFIAKTGWTTSNLLAAINDSNIKGSFDIVSLLIGVNDQYQLQDTSGYRGHFTECLEKAITFAGGKKEHVFVVSIPDYSVTPFASGTDRKFIATQIDQFNSINLEVSTAYGVSYTDVTTISREVKDDPAMIADDGLHPSGKQYALWAASLSERIASKY